jgi:hypothetical protein
MLTAITPASVVYFWKRVDKFGATSVSAKTPCWQWTGKTIDSQGYGFVGVKVNGKWLGVRAHRFSWELHKGRIPNDMCVLHVCDNPSCVNPKHLFLGTRLDNTKDMVNKTRQARGERNGQAILNEKQVRFIKKKYKAGCRKYGCRAFAKQFGVDPATICLIANGTNWKHVI